MTRYHVINERIVTPAVINQETGEVTTPESVAFNTRQVAFTPDEEAAADAAETNVSQDQYVAAIESLVDATAQARRYSDGVSLASYKDSTVSTWAAEATAFIAWRDAVWTYAYAQLALVQGGQRAQPSIDTLLGELPTITWPS